MSIQKFKIIIIFFTLTLSIISSCDAHLVGLTVSPDKHNFNNVNIGDFVEFTVTIKNISTTPIRLTNFNVMGAPSFTIASGDTPKLLAGNQLHRLILRFEPTTAGVQSATIQIFHDGPGRTRTTFLTGTGIPVPKIEIPSNFDFGTVGIGNTDTHDFLVKNIGSANLLISLFNFDGNPALFSLTAGGTTPVTVIPGATHTVTVQFAPTATGSFPTRLSVTHNGINEMTPLQIDISAAGGGGKIEFNQTSPWDFGAAATGGSTTEIVEISNTGSIDLNINSISLGTGTFFTVDKIEDSTGNPITTPFAISPADFVELSIKFAPTTAGNYNDTLNIAHDGSYSVTPATFNLTGSARTPITQTFNYTGRIENWNVPAGAGSAIIEVWGAQGGDVSLLSRPGGKGARMRGDFRITPGESLKILVGGKAQNVSWVSGGGGGSFVTRSNNDPMIIAGGGGGTIYQVTSHAGNQATTNSTANNGYNGTRGGSAGNGGQSTRGGGGGGLLTDGAEQTNRPNTKGKAFVNGGAGGARWVPDTNTGGGGFGGGGAGIRRNNSIYDQGAGGGGGYSGGGGAGSNNHSHGGGGGSYNSGTNTSNTGGTRTGNGQIQITY